MLGYRARAADAGINFDVRLLLAGHHIHQVRVVRRARLEGVGLPHEMLIGFDIGRAFEKLGERLATAFTDNEGSVPSNTGSTRQQLPVSSSSELKPRRPPVRRLAALNLSKGPLQ